MDAKAASKEMKRIIAFIMDEFEKSGLNYGQFAEKAGIARSCLYNWSADLHTPNLLTVIMALDAEGYEIAIRRKADDAERNA